MTGGMHDRYGATLSRRATAAEPSIASLVVRLHHQGHSCIASFSGALTATTRATIDGVANLVNGETAVVLDFSRVDVVDDVGAHAVETLVQSVRARGGKLQISEPRTPRGGFLSGGTKVPGYFSMSTPVGTTSAKVSEGGETGVGAGT
jgi:anti-anti-sigma regulatory factor